MKNEINKLFYDIIAKIPYNRKRKNQISMRIAGIMHDRLKELKMSNAEFARSFKKHESQIHRWLSGEHNFTIKTIADIEDKLKVDLIELPNRKSLNTKDFESLANSVMMHKLKEINKASVPSENATIYQLRTGTDG